jgi:CspA family cold shock protein
LGYFIFLFYSDMDAERQTGTVQYFNSEKGFGFIVPGVLDREALEALKAKRDNNTPRYFFHFTALRKDEWGQRRPAEGEVVTFVAGENEKGTNASDIAMAESQESAAPAMDMADDAEDDMDEMQY